MPRSYKRLKPNKVQDPEVIKAAVEDITNGLSLRNAAAKYDIHYSVLYRHLKKGDQIKKKGGQTALTEEEEKTLASRLIICADWGYPIDPWTLRILVKESLDRQGRTIKKFKDNFPGRDFVYSFLNRHKADLSQRLCQNIKRVRAGVSPETINEYFDRLEAELRDVPSSNIINYDETNLSDDPGKHKVITKRGCKYPERVMNSTKCSISVMFSAAGDGHLLPPYVVYKSLHLYESWREGGPDGSRYNRTKSGWFDNFCFSDYVETIALPYLRRLPGKKYMIGDNLSSHLSFDLIKKCAENDVHFIFLPANSTHLTQPLDVAFFRPLKMAWRSILLDWKKGPGKNEATIQKSKFPSLLNKLCESCKSENVISGFRKCGIVPLNRKEVLKMLPSSDLSIESTQSSRATTPALSPVAAIDASFKELLTALRHTETVPARKKRVKVDVGPGKSVSVADFPPDPDQAGPSTSVAGTSTDNDNSTGTRKQSVSARKNKNKKLDSESSPEDSDYSVQDSDSDLTLSDSSANAELSKELDRLIQPDDFVIVKVYGKTKNVFRMYVSKVTDFQDDGYVGLFCKKTLSSNMFSLTDEESFFSKDDVIKKLMLVVQTSKSASRWKDKICFQDDLSAFIIY